MFTRILSIVAASACVALASIGVVAAPGATVGWVVAGAIISLSTWLGIQSSRTQEIPSAAAPGRWASIAAGASVLAVCLVLTGIVVVLGQAAGPVILLMGLATAAWAWSWFTRRHTNTDRPGDGGEAVFPEVLPASVETRALSTAQLCARWQQTYFALAEQPPGASRCELVRIRENLLDELERRDRDGFARWLGTGARAGSDPSRYLLTDPQS